MDLLRRPWVDRLAETVARSWRLILRASLVACPLVLVLFVIFRLSAPYLISSTLVRAGMETAISHWTGHRAVIGGRPELEFWPVPKITLEDVTIQKPASEGGQVPVRVEHLSATFSLVKALLGEPVFHDFHFLRPRITLSRDRSGLLDLSSDGLLSAAIRAARPAGNTQVLEAGLNAQVGSMTIEDGSLVFSDQTSGRTFTLNGITADIEWPSLADGLTASVLARLRDQDVKLDVSSAQPLLLFAGRNAAAKGSFASPSLTARFDGTANLAAYAFFSGGLELAVSDIPALLAWSGAHLPSVQQFHSAAATAQIMTTDSSLRFNDLQFSIDNSTASGILDLTVPASGRPKLAGTLAFNEMNIRAFLAAFSLNIPSQDAVVETADTAFLRNLDLDLRLSAQRAALDPFELRDIGASVLIAGGKATFDIGDSMFEGGALSGHLQVAERSFEGGGTLQISIRDADLESAVERLQLKGPLPLSRGSLDLSLKTLKPIWATSIEDISGTFHLFAQAGALRQFDAQSFRALAAAKPFFRMSEVADDTFDFDSIDLVADFADGEAVIRSAGMTGRNESLTLSGVIPYGSNSIALAGTLQATAPAEATDYPPLRFFAGGSWPDPVISTVSIGDTKPLQ